MEDVPVTGGLPLGVLPLAFPPGLWHRGPQEGPGRPVRRFFKESDGTYGYRWIHADLAGEGTECSPELVRPIMRQEFLVPCQRRPFRTTTVADAEVAEAMPDLVKRDFTADRPGVKFVEDITYVHTSWIPAVVATRAY